MKVCRICGAQCDDSDSFCQVCGKPLKKQKNSVVIAIIAAVAILVLTTLVIIAGSALSRQKKDIDSSRRQKEIAELENTPHTSDAVIDDYDYRVSGGYVYIDGTIRNTSNKYISYYEIGIQYVDAYGNVVDSDWTNGNKLGAFESQSFDAMHKNSGNWKKIRVYVREVS